jgi:predicted nucleic acid-binding protein
MAMAWGFEEETSDQTTEVLRFVTEHGACVPNLWFLEVANGFLIACRRGRCENSRADAALDWLGELPITVDGQTNDHAWIATLELARSEGLTAYDAAYLELARRLCLPLATLDKQLIAAALRQGVRVMGVEHLA